MKTVLTTWGCVGVGDVVCPAPGAEWEVIEVEYVTHDPVHTFRVTLRRGESTSTSEVRALQPVYILDKVTAAAERDGVDPAEVAAGVLTSGGLAPESVAPPGQTGAAILEVCPECGALTYPGATRVRHVNWHAKLEGRLVTPY